MTLNRLRRFERLAVVAALFVVLVGPTAAHAQQTGSSTDTGTVTSAATASPYAELALGGPASLAGNLGGAITNNGGQGAAITGLDVGLGEIGPANSSAFVVATIPLRLRSNVGYALTIQVTSFTNFLPADSRNVTLADIGFGISPLLRTGVGALASSADTAAAGSINEPTTGGYEDPATGHWIYSTNLASFQSAQTLMSGPRVMRAVPKSTMGGVYSTAKFCVKPQWFSPGGFATTIVLTAVTP